MALLDKLTDLGKSVAQKSGEIAESSKLSMSIKKKEKEIRLFQLEIGKYVYEQYKNEQAFDEKIMGSFHFTPGAAYDDCFNGNRSALHWDLVCIQTPEWGGGEMYFDDVLVRKDGRFVLPELECLNPENLK